MPLYVSGFRRTCGVGSNICRRYLCKERLHFSQFLAIPIRVISRNQFVHTEYQYLEIVNEFLKRLINFNHSNRLRIKLIQIIKKVWIIQSKSYEFYIIQSFIFHKYNISHSWNHIQVYDYDDMI